MEYKSFSGKKILNRESILINTGGSNEETFSEIDPNWKNTFAFRLGGEYFKEANYGTIPLRFGFGYTPLPDPDFNLNVFDSTVAGSSVTSYSYSAGTGIHWAQIHFDLAYTYYSVDRSHETYIPTSIGYVYHEYENKTRNHHFNVSFTGVF